MSQMTPTTCSEPHSRSTCTSDAESNNDTVKDLFHYGPTRFYARPEVLGSASMASIVRDITEETTLDNRCVQDQHFGGLNSTHDMMTTWKVQPNPLRKSVLQRSLCIRDMAVKGTIKNLYRNGSVEQLKEKSYSSNRRRSAVVKKLLRCIKNQIGSDGSKHGRKLCDNTFTVALKN